MNVIFTCGGTGGHINPAIAVANIWKERDPEGWYTALFVPRLREVLHPQLPFCYFKDKEKAVGLGGLPALHDGPEDTEGIGRGMPDLRIHCLCLAA